MLTKTIILFMMATASFAQDSPRPTDRGTVVLEGSAMCVYLDDGATGGNSYSVFQASPTVGLFVFDHFMVGLTSFLQLESRHSCFPGDEQLLGGPIVGYYADPGSKRDRIAGSFLPFARTFFVYGSTLGQMNHAVTKYGGEAGIAVMVSNTMGIEFLGRYSRDRVSNWNEQFRWGGFAPDVKDATGTIILFGVGFTAFL